MTEPAVGYISSGDVAIRADAEGDGKSIYGYAYRWGQLTTPGGTAEYGTLAQGFESGAFREAIAQRGERPWPFLDRHGDAGGRVVGSVRFREDAIGLAYEGRLLDTNAAREYAETVPAGNDGVSLEFVNRGSVAKRNGRTITLSRCRASRR